MVCSCCGEEFNENELTKVYKNSRDFDYVCDCCMESLLVDSEVYQCDDCNRYFYTESDYCSYIDSLDRTLCDDCLTNSYDYFYCDSCESWNYTSDRTCITDTCNNEEYNWCDSCVEDSDYTYYCNNCNNYYCDEDYNGNYEEYLCPNCRQENSQLISSYHNYFRPFKTRYVNNENESVLIGFELEVENNKNEITNNEMAKKILDILGDDDFVLFATDGSLSDGFEIISDPLTKDYFTSEKIQSKWCEVLESLSSNGFTSHNSGRCGLHFHISREIIDKTNYFDEYNNYNFDYNKQFNDKNINKLMIFFETYKQEIKEFSRRNNYNYCSFVSDNINIEIKNENKSSDYFKKAKENGCIQRHQVINLGNKKTIEIRVMRGTLKYNSFMASYYFIVSLIENIINKNMSAISLNNIIYNKKYPLLMEYAKEKQIDNGAKLKDYNTIIKNIRTKQFKNEIVFFQKYNDLFYDLQKNIDMLVDKETNKKNIDINKIRKLKNLKGNISNYILYYDQKPERKIDDFIYFLSYSIDKNLFPKNYIDKLIDKLAILNEEIRESKKESEI